MLNSPLFRIFALFLCAVALGAEPPSISPAELSAAIAARRADVLEFRFVAEAAKELGVRVWLFGGTAAGFAHYVKWD